MTPQLHLINFPAAETFFKPEFLARVNGIDRTKQNVLVLDAVDAINEQHLIFKGNTWSTVYVFFHHLSDTPTKSYLHDDIDHSTNTKSFIPKVNWTLNDKRVLDFWSNNNVTEINQESMSEYTHPIIRYSTNIEAEQSYNTNAGDVYLLNGETPHQATSYNDSFSISIVSDSLTFLSWEQIVELFTDEII